MDNIRQCIDILFRQMPQDTVIKSFFGKVSSKINTSNINKYLFINTAQNEIKHYSEDELENLYIKLNEWIRDSRQLYNTNPSIFNLLISFSEDILVENSSEIQCRYEQLMRWREISHKFGQDFFITSYLAYIDIVSGRERKFFQWNPIISTNNIRLHNLLKNGLAENHFHLKGSAPTWDLTWISLMNRIEGRLEEFNYCGLDSKKLEPEMLFSSEFHQSSFYELFKIAATIRAFLFCKLKGIYLLNTDNKNEETTLLERYITDSLYMKEHTNDIQKNIDSLKYKYGKTVKTNLNKTYYLDYATGSDIVNDTVSVSNIYFTGERYFLYSMFKKIYEKTDIEFEKYHNLFYAYLIIKTKMRHEFVQANTRVGFKNFSDYQDRKTIFLKKEPLLNDAVYDTAICSTIKNQHIKSLEARIAPENSSKELSETIKKIDDIVKFNDESINDKFFYVIHFIKSKDKDNFTTIDCDMKSRHYQKRIEVKRQSIAITKLRNNLYYGWDKICGIDACSNEIGCRPEVFAQAFRYLRSNATNIIIKNIEGVKALPKLGATYHAGEDFLDIVDGLRAIDEAINFLNLKQGDRIGHALALGINATEWYKFKNRKLFLTKQDYLDNIVWLLIKIKEFDIINFKNLIYKLEEEYYQLFLEVYQENFEIEKSKNFFSHREYYDAWRLRGNDPNLYFIPGYKEKIAFNSWDNCAINYSFPEDKYVRENENVQFLYNSYHFNSKIRKKGAEIKEFCVSDDYINVVNQIQYKMQIFIRNLGIGIEANPSSNYLIGTFRRYENHPLVNMYNLGLTCESSKITECPQLFVSINTDDQGIFDTYIENEYALMAVALEKSKNSDGSNKYNSAMIYDWLDRIRRMGLEQVFKK